VKLQKDFSLKHSCPVHFVHLSGEKGDFFSFFHQNKEKKRCKENPVLVCASVHYFHLLGDCLFVILRAFIELEQTLIRSVDEAALLKGKSELER